MRIEKTSLMHGLRIIAITREVFREARRMGNAEHNAETAHAHTAHHTTDAGDTEPAVFCTDETSATA